MIICVKKVSNPWQTNSFYVYRMATYWWQKAEIYMWFVKKKVCQHMLNHCLQRTTHKSSSLGSYWPNMAQFYTLRSIHSSYAVLHRRLNMSLEASSSLFSSGRSQFGQPFLYIYIGEEWNFDMSLLSIFFGALGTKIRTSGCYLISFDIQIWQYSTTYLQNTVFCMTFVSFPIDRSFKTIPSFSCCCCAINLNFVWSSYSKSQFKKTPI